MLKNGWGNGMTSHIFTIGEALIDFISMQENATIAQVQGFSRQAGGAPANVAVAVARLGGRTAFFGSVGRDPFGDFLIETMGSYGVETSYIVRVEHATSLAFVARREGESHYFFVRNPGADTCLESSHVENIPMASDVILHFGSNSLAESPLRETLHTLLLRASREQSLVSFDVNLRPAFWGTVADAKRLCTETVTLVDLVKVNRDELVWLSDREDEQAAIAHVAQMTHAVVVCTLGSRGVLIHHRDWEHPIQVVGRSVSVVDTTGAGDAFIGALLYQLGQAGVSHADLVTLGEVKWRLFCEFATASAALTVGKFGAMAAMPTLAEVEHFLRDC